MKFFTGSLLLVLMSAALTQADDTEWTEFVADVKEAVSNYSAYIFPTTNEAVFSGVDTTESEDFGTFDFIIVGAGTAGGVLANRLTEENFTVLVLEAGSAEPSWAKVTGISGYFYNSQWNWGYNTTVQTNACLASKNQQCFIPRGKVVGGTSVIGGAWYMRGHQEDYDNWVELGAEGWSYEECLPYFKVAEHADFTVDIDEDYHGFDGPQHVNITADTEGVTDNIIEAFEELNKTLRDYNGVKPDLSRMQFLIDFNEKASTSQAYITPVANRTNLNITSEAFVFKILIEDSLAYGVQFVKNGVTYNAYANNEVILSAGAINSPQILMLSGIGPADDLEALGIDVVADLPVGQNLIDQIGIRGIYFRTNQTFYNYTLAQSLDLWRLGERPLNAGINVQAVSFWKFSNDSLTRPDTDIYVHPAGKAYASFLKFEDEYIQAYQAIHDLTDVAVSTILFRPKSRGTVTLQSSDPTDFPLMNTNFLSDDDDEDIETLYQSIQVGLSLNTTSAFQKWNATYVELPVPGCDDDYDRLSKEWWYCTLRHLAVSLYTPVGTTRMGIDSSCAVVDTDLKVYGIDGLRVVDAGVMPDQVSGYTLVPVTMIAEKIAVVIKEDYA